LYPHHWGVCNENLCKGWRDRAGEPTAPPAACPGSLMSDPAPVRFAYVGCGFVAQSIHIPNFASLPDCDFVALAEVREELGRSVQQRFGIRKLYRSHEEVAADPEIEAVGVSAP